jgi:hypothetical protein
MQQRIHGYIVPDMPQSGYFVWASGPFSVQDKMEFYASTAPDGSGGPIYGAGINFDSSLQVRTGPETKPASISAYLCIKY